MSTAQSQAETEKQKRDFIQKLVEIRRKQQRQKKESEAIKDK